MATRFKLGKKPARPEAVKLWFHHYVPDTSALPPVPDTYGHQGAVTDWGMLANDQIGDCGPVAALHALKLWAAETGRSINITDAAAIRNYHLITGYDPTQTDADGNNPTDQGTDLRELLEYWRTTGLIDDDGNRHTIAGSVGLRLGDHLLDEIKAAVYLYDGLLVGINCPAQYQDLFQHGQPWGAVENPNYEGGHAIVLVGKPDAGHDAVTWAGLVDFLPEGIMQNVDEAWAVISHDRIADSGTDANGFNWSQLTADLPQLGNI